MLPLNNDRFLISTESFSIYKFASLDSTNLFLKTHIARYLDYTVIMTENQYGGRGRFDRKWQTVAGRSLAFSIKLPLKRIPQKNWSNITQVMALSVSLMMEEMGLKPQIRWPNDILVCGVKICGILAETLSIESESWLILGVGLNINEEKRHFAGIDRAATSLHIETGETFDIDEILKKLLLIFKGQFDKFVELGFCGLVEEISQRLYKPDGLVQVIQGNETFSGKISGITDQGTILIETPEKTVEVVSGEITSHID